MNDIMLDLETLGCTPGSVVLSIGVVRFDVDHGVGEGVGGAFYLPISLDTAMSAGLTIDPDTLRWWVAEERADLFRRTLAHPSARPLRDVLTDLAVWLSGRDDVRVWGCGSDFDAPILAAAYRACGLPVPWKHTRCYRTLRALRRDIAIERVGEYHDALDDARSQAAHAVAILRAIRGP